MVVLSILINPVVVEASSYLPVKSHRQEEGLSIFRHKISILLIVIYWQMAKMEYREVVVEQVVPSLSTSSKTH